MPLAYTRKKRTIVIEVDCHRRKGQHPHAERQGQKNRERSLGELVFVLFHTKNPLFAGFIGRKGSGGWAAIAAPSFQETTVGPLLCAPAFRPVYHITLAKRRLRRLRRAPRKGPHQQPGWHSANQRLSPLALQSHRFRWFAHSPVFARVPARARAALMAAHPPVSSPLSPSPPEKIPLSQPEKTAGPSLAPSGGRLPGPCKKVYFFATNGHRHSSSQYYHTFPE